MVCNNGTSEKNLLLSVLQVAFETSRLWRFGAQIFTTRPAGTTWTGCKAHQDAAFVVLRLLASCVLHRWC